MTTLYAEERQLVCPCGHHCQPRFMGWTNQEEDVDYYRCDRCGHFWSVPRSALLKPTPLNGSLVDLGQTPE